MMTVEVSFFESIDGAWGLHFQKCLQKQFLRGFRTMDLMSAFFLGRTSRTYMCDRVDQLTLFPYNRGWSSTQY